MSRGSKLIVGGAAAFFLAFAASMAIPQPSGQVTVIGAVTPGDCARFASVTQLQDGGNTCPGLAPVQSVFGRTGAVVGLLGDYTPATGGTGINNGANTITIAGNFATSGAFPFTQTVTATTNSTFPAGTHTLGGLDVTQVWSAPQTFNASDFILAGSGGASQVLKQTSSGAAITVSQLAQTDITLSQLNNTLGANVLLNNTANFFDGPSVAQGTSGTWYASGSVTVQDTAAAGTFLCKLWDGTTVMGAGVITTNGTGFGAMSLSGFLTTPAANIRISCRDITSISGLITFNSSTTSKDAYINVWRVS